MSDFPKAHQDTINDFVNTVQKRLMTDPDNPHDIFDTQYKKAIGILQDRMAGAEADALQEVMKQLRDTFVNGINDMLKAGAALNTTRTDLDITGGRQGYYHDREQWIHYIADKWLERVGSQREQVLQAQLQRGYVGEGRGMRPMTEQEKQQLEAQLRETTLQMGHEGDSGDLNSYILGVLHGDQDRNTFWTEHVADFFTDESNTDWDSFFNNARDELKTPENNLQNALGNLIYLGSGPWQQFSSAFDSATTVNPNGGPGIPNIPGLPTFPGPGDPGGGGGGGGDGGGSGGGGDGGGSGGGSGGFGGPIPAPTIATTWSDTQPDQFPQPQNMEDIASEIIRRQGGRHHLMLITHYGAPDQNTWLVTLPDRGNENFTQDPGDPGGYHDNFSATSGSDGGSLASGTSGMSLTGSTTASGASAAGSDASNLSPGMFTDSGTGDADTYLNNTQAIRTELAGRLSPYGQFAAEAIQKYCTSQPPDQSGAAQDGGAPLAQAGPGAGASDLGGVMGNILNGAMQATAPKLTCPPTSPQSPAHIMLAGHGLGGMVAQNLAAQKPFPGDNPNLSPAHVISGVLAFGAPIVGKYVPGISYNFFNMPGDRVGDIPVDTVGVNDQRAQDVQKLTNPFLSSPWQSTDPTKPNYVKDPNDPQVLHSAYADSDALKNTKLPFDLKGAGRWGPTYVVVIPQVSTSVGSDTGASTSGMGQGAAVASPSMMGTSGSPGQ